MNHVDISKPFLLSLLAHLVLVLMFTVKAVLFPSTEELYQPALRVDMVDLPDKLAPINETPAPAEPPKPEEKPALPPPTPPAPKPEPVKSKPVEKPDLVLDPKKTPDKKEDKSNTSDAIEKLKKKMAIDKIKEEITQKERQELKQKVTQYKGNVLAPGTELTGIAKLQHENYLGQIDKHVKQFWSLPEWLARGDYKAKVKVFLDSRGFLTRAELLSSSGNSSYDDIVIETIKKAVPYPVPPDKFRDIMSVNGMVLGFPE